MHGHQTNNNTHKTCSFRNEGVIGALAKLIESWKRIDTDYNESWNRMPAGLKTKFTGFVNCLQDQRCSADFEKETAWKDAENATADIFNTFKEEEVPKILTEMNLSGAYSASCTQKQLDYAYAQAVSKAATLKLDTGIRYAEVQNIQSGAVNSAYVSALQTQESHSYSGEVKHHLNWKDGLVEISAFVLADKVTGGLVEFLTIGTNAQNKCPK